MTLSKSDNKTFKWPNGQTRGLQHRDWDTQLPPYKKPLEYHFAKTRYNFARVRNASDPNDHYEPYPFYFERFGDSFGWNNVMMDLQGRCGDPSSWGTNLVEANQAVGMVERRLLQVASAANAIRKHNFGAAAKILDLNNIPKGVKAKAKAFSNNFLEYHFGWEPAMADIHDSLQTMTQADFGKKVIRVRRNSAAARHYSSNDAVGMWIKDITWQDTGKAGCTVTISNESVYLANQVGLLNPLSVAWDTVPFSFVADWFANVGDVLSSITGFCGLDVQDAFVVGVHEGKLDQSFYSADGGYSTTESLANVYVDRLPGLLGIKLEVRPFKGFSPSRGLSAAALLLQRLG